jgi:hydroxymethylbilane synthase
LSLTQTDHVVNRLIQKNPDLKVDRKIIESAGDAAKGRSLLSLEQRGILDREIDQQILEGRIDFAVHNMKDVPLVDRTTRLMVASVMERGSPAEALVSRDDRKLEDLPKGSRVGTSSPIRAAQLRHARPDLKPEPLWGEIEKRVERVDSGEIDATILAEAGLARLGIAYRISERLPVEEFMPAPGQGALVIVARRDNLKVIETLRTVEHPPTRLEVDAERELVRILEGASKVPVGGLASARGDRIQITACILSVDGREKHVAARSGNTKDGMILAREIADELVTKGAPRIGETWRTAQR